MVDNLNPTSQFHPYQPTDATPQSEKVQSGGLSGILNKLGINQSTISSVTDKVKNADVRGSIDQVRGMARNNGSLVLGGLAAAAIGAGLLWKRNSSMSR